ncbi:class I adenylate-forming enzyme family protein [Brevibacterium album]|uniref:class I adenylate-forming enzyme family protein n=1 Tax=Brevibacterium album TaxID=417948 RepID=UPI0004016506|nr:class I adenylate-forming enzyme family protein [Brevibacterium album]
MPPHHPGPAPTAAPLPDTFARLWSATATAHADSPFLLFMDPDGTVTRWSYGEFAEVVACVQQTLEAAGVTVGSAVHLCLRNSPAFVALWLAAARLGAWIVPVDPESTARDIADHVSRVAPALGVCARTRSAIYREGAAGTPVIELEETAADLAPGGPLLARTAEPGTDARPRPEDRLAVMFTSGSTSRPKGVKLTQANYAQVGLPMARAAGLQREHRWFVSLPLFHANAQYYCFASAIAVGASVALASGFSAGRWLEQCRSLEATHTSLFAAPIRMILARTPEDAKPLELRHAWFAQPLSTDQYARFTRLIGCAPRQLYGMTETVAAVTADAATADADGTSRPETIGRPLPGRSTVLLDPATLAEAAPGSPGVIAVAGEPGVDLFEGYLDDPATTARTLIRGEDGSRLLLTGDLASADEDGRLRFVGRTDDVIKVAGENVSLAEVETTVAEAPGVQEAAVIAVRDEIRDTVPEAYIVPADPDLPPSGEELDAWAARNLTPAARPRAWHIIDALPRTSVGKIRRFLVGSPQATGTR